MDGPLAFVILVPDQDEDINRYKYDGITRNPRYDDMKVKDKSGEIIMLFNPFCVGKC